MATAEILQAEARERPRTTIVAIVAAVFTLAAPVVGWVAAGAPPDNLPAALFFYHDNQLSQYASAACSVIGALAIAFVLDFLYRAAKARNPELPWQIRPLPWIGGIGVAVFTIGYQVALAVNVEHFVTQGSHTYEEARKAVDAGLPPLLGVFVQLALALAIVMISINAMRVGLLTRFLGYLGVISGALFILGGRSLPVPIVQVYWLGALAMLFAGRSPNGTPPAWQSGEAMPWPSPAEMREQRVREAEARRGGDVVEGAVADDEPATAGSTSATAKRKRKKRR